MTQINSFIALISGSWPSWFFLWKSYEHWTNFFPYYFFRPCDNNQLTMNPNAKKSQKKTDIAPFIYIRYAFVNTRKITAKFFIRHRWPIRPRSPAGLRWKSLSWTVGVCGPRRQVLPKIGKKHEIVSLFEQCHNTVTISEGDFCVKKYLLL